MGLEFGIGMGVILALGVSRATTPPDIHALFDSEDITAALEEDPTEGKCKALFGKVIRNVGAGAFGVAGGGLSYSLINTLSNSTFIPYCAIAGLFITAIGYVIETSHHCVVAAQQEARVFRVQPWGEL